MPKPDLESTLQSSNWPLELAALLREARIKHRTGQNPELVLQALELAQVWFEEYANDGQGAAVIDVGVPRD